MKAFVFRITEACNKRCLTCCCGTTGAAMDPDSFREQALEIKKYSDESDQRPVICLTGGEAFLFRGRNPRGEIWSIVDLIRGIRSWVPNALIMVKTSGWGPHRVLDRFLEEIELLSADTHLEIRLGFNLYQNGGADAEERLEHMIRSVLRYQDTMRIETIFDRDNLSPTFAVIERTLVRQGALIANLEGMMTSPERGCRFMIPLGGLSHRLGEDALGKRVLLDAMPAYPGLEGNPSDRFMEAVEDRPCPTIQNGPTSIMYQPNLSFHHCNDAFADFSNPPFPRSQFHSVEEQFAFLESRFASLRVHLEESGMTFRTRRKRCVYCSHFIHRLDGGDLIRQDTLRLSRLRGC